MQRTQVIGVLNITPDSFFEGSRTPDVAQAVARAERMLREGADWIEIGGESTGPGSRAVPPSEELERVIPVIRRLREALPQAKLSIDTYKPFVAEQALREGVGMVNDVTAGRADPAMFATLAASDALFVLMYAKLPTPHAQAEPRRYMDVVAETKQFLRERRDAAVAQGIAVSRLILDPGLGHFVSSLPEYSYEIIARLEEYVDLGCPLLLSPSRKSFLAGSRNLTPAERLPGTVAASAIAALHGASYIRTHDVSSVVVAVEVVESVMKRRMQE